LALVRSGTWLCLHAAKNAARIPGVVACPHLSPILAKGVELVTVRAPARFDGGGSVVRGRSHAKKMVRQQAMPLAWLNKTARVDNEDRTRSRVVGVQKFFFVCFCFL